MGSYGSAGSGNVSFPLQNTASSPSREPGQIPHGTHAGVLAGTVVHLGHVGHAEQNMKAVVIKFTTKTLPLVKLLK